MKPFYPAVLFLLALSSPRTLTAQDAVGHYVNAAGEYARLFSGELEEVYSVNIYRNQPYYHSEEYTTGDVTFRHHAYPSITMRLDLHRNRLAVVSPQGKTRLYLSGEDVQSVSLHNATFIYLPAGNAHRLEQGYYQLIARGDGFQVLARKNYVLHSASRNYFADETITDRRAQYFSYHCTYYYVSDAQCIRLKKLSTFVKCFPELRAELKSYIRKHDLKMGQESDADSSLHRLATYARQLLAERRQP